MSDIRVLIIEDEPLIAEDIAACLEEVGYFISGIAFNSERALLELAHNAPDIVMLDINLNSEMDGVQIAEHINQQYKLPFVFLTSYSDKATIDRVKHTRPMGYIVKPFDEHDLFTTLEIALFNFSQRQKPAKLEMESLNRKLHSPLTTKEFEVLESIFEGKTNKQISQDHYVSLNTIKTHLKRIYDKLDVRTRTEAIVKVRGL